VLLGLIGFVPLVRAQKIVMTTCNIGPTLVPALQLTSVAELLYAAGLFAGLLIGR
jgi:1,4-dihydroxy-2-naphthoate octaprenyltransferase